MELVTAAYADKLEEHLRSISLEGLESTSALLNHIQTQARAVSLQLRGALPPACPVKRLPAHKRSLRARI